MKRKLIYIFSLVFILYSCSADRIEMPEADCGEGKVKVDFSVVVPDVAGPSTKVLGDAPVLQNLYLAVFDEAGYLAEYVKANLDNLQSATANGIVYKYTVTLSLSDTPRTIHWIGNAPESVNYGSEESVMMGMKTIGDEDAYWYRKVIDKVEAVSGVDGAIPTDKLVADLSNIPLIRNFAKISLVNNSANFTIDSYAVVNSPKESYTVAYNFSKGNFVEYFKNNDGEIAPKSHKELLDEGYDASIPSNVNYFSLEEAWNKKVEVEVGVGESEACYVYEREKPLQLPVYIIVYGKYKDSEENSYFKINLRDENDNYFPLLRNFHYKVQLNEVYRNGYATAEEAAASGGSGDISTALQTESLIYMSDGAASLEVSSTDIVKTTSDPFEVAFVFYPDLQNLESIYKGEIESVYKASVEIYTNDDAGAAGDAIASISAPSYSTDGAKVTVTPTEPGDIPKSQSFTILAKYTPSGSDIERTIQRKVKLTVMNTQLMTVECVPSEIPALKGEPFEVCVNIPSGLSAGMFPLEFKVESDALSITPNLAKSEYMTLSTGKSISGSGKPTLFYVKALSWVDYKNMDEKEVDIQGKKTKVKTLKIFLKSIKASSKTEVLVANDFFYGYFDGVRRTYAQASLGNFTPQYFTDLKFNPEKIERIDNAKVEFSFTMDKMPDDGIIIFEVENIYPDEESGENRLNAKSAVQYEYKPSSVGTHTFKFFVPDKDIIPKITLKAHHFIDASASVQRVSSN